MLETSLGYYLNPIVNVILGSVFLSERLHPAQLSAVGLASLGVLNEIVAVGVLPWAGITLAVSFGILWSGAKEARGGLRCRPWRRNVVVRAWVPRLPGDCW